MVVFADTPCEGIYIGHVWSECLAPAFGAELVARDVMRPPPGEADAPDTDDTSDSTEREAVCGHEDVNPIERWGWDPNQGFDWERLFELARKIDTPVA